MAANDLKAVVTADGLSLNGRLFVQDTAIEQFYAALGQPSRVFPAGQPAPYGHRNNHVHPYDVAGIHLSEHHATRLIGAVTFEFDCSESPFPPEVPL